MDRNAVERFSVNARVRLRRNVESSMAGLGIGEGCEPVSVDASGDTYILNLPGGLRRGLTSREYAWRGKLIDAVSGEGYDNVVEQVAYTWFNRLIAIRYMEVNDYLPTHVRVLSSMDPEKKEPDLVTQCIRMSDALGLTAEEKEDIVDLKDRSRSDELFSKMFLYECRSLNAVLPELFSETKPYEKLLINLSYTVQDGVVRELVDTVPEEDFRDAVQIIGWMYQYYNSELKDEVFSDLKKNVKISKERIPAATQLFTPDWIVRYMVENSLGRVWLEGHPDDDLRSKWRYCLEEAKQEPQVAEALKRLRESRKRMEPSDIRIIDPCMGSGHVLVYAFDVLMQIYESYGYSKPDAASSILENNIFGLDIDERAYQLAYFAVMMKARGYDPNIFGKGLKPNLHAILETSAMDESCLEGFGNGMSPTEKNSVLKDMRYLIDVFRDAKTYGSLIKIKELDFGRIAAFLKARSINIFARENVLDEVVAIAEVLSGKYDAVITNPPYMGSSGMDSKLSQFVKDAFPNSKSDIFACFIERCMEMTKEDSFTSMITQHAFMFLSSFEKLRNEIIREKTIVNMVHQGARGFDQIGGEVVQTVAFTICNNSLIDYTGTYCRLVDEKGEFAKESKFLSGENRFYVKQSRFDAIPGAPIAYWLTNNDYLIFKKSELFGSLSKLCAGLATGNNDIFQRYWFEVNYEDICFNATDCQDTVKRTERWYPCNSGGKFRKWANSDIYVVDWQNNGNRIKNYKNSKGKLAARPQNTDYYFKAGISWNKISSSKFAVRYKDAGSIFDDTSRSIFPNDEKLLYYYIGILCSTVSDYYLKALNPSMSFTNADIYRIPCLIDYNSIEIITTLVKQNISLSKDDWNQNEISWNYISNPLIGNYERVEDAIRYLSSLIDNRYNNIKNNEEKINKMLMERYNLSAVADSNVDPDNITVDSFDTIKAIKQLVSYSVGCIFGRYSLESEGVQHPVNLSSNKLLPVDLDNIVPINEIDYFSDDIVVRFVEFIKIAFGEDHLEENLKFIADNLGIKYTGTARDGIRKYFLNSFYDDHVRMYQKRPIYWLFDSGKENGFKALIYMHRYTPDLISKMRQDYLLPMLSRYTEQLNTVDEVTKISIQKKIAEIQTYDIAMEKYASEKVSIDLDDGVKVNYAKFQNIENPGSRKRIDLLHPLK